MSYRNVCLLGFAVLASLAFANAEEHSDALPAAASAAPVSESLLGGMRWRQVGPFRGGRVLAVTGVSRRTKRFLFRRGFRRRVEVHRCRRDWEPLFDKEDTASIGSIAVAPSDPNMIYVGTGEACLRGNISLRRWRLQIQRSPARPGRTSGCAIRGTSAELIVDPRNPNTVFVAALGHAYGPNAERGVFRTTDGGKTWQKVLYMDEKTGAIDIVFDPNNSNIALRLLVPGAIAHPGP